MTRLVLHAGTHCTDGASIRQQLVSWRKPLDLLGVRQHPADDTDVWSSDLEDLSVGSPSNTLIEAAASAVHDGSVMLLLSSETLEDALREPAALANLKRFAADAGMSLTIICVIRDQLGYLNEIYCDRITRLQIARDFASFVADPQPAGRFDYGTAFDLVLTTMGPDFIAIPYTGLTTGAQGRALLVAAGARSRRRRQPATRVDARAAARSCRGRRDPAALQADVADGHVRRPLPRTPARGCPAAPARTVAVRAGTRAPSGDGTTRRESRRSRASRPVTTPSRRPPGGASGATAGRTAASSTWTSPRAVPPWSST